MWCLMPRQQVTSGFFRIQSLVVLGLSVLAFLAAGHFQSGARPAPTSSLASESTANADHSDSGMTLIRTAAIAAGLCGYLGSVLWRLDVRRGGTWCLFGVFAATLLGLIGLTGGISALETSAGLFHLVSCWSSAAVLGGATTGMLLGHWYLTAPTMSIDPLKRMAHLFFAALVIRLAISVGGWVQAEESVQGSLIWTWLSLRWLAGILAPLVLAVMTDRILRYRNTQAATGVLFAAVILVFLGEMSAALLFAELQKPL